MMQLSRIVNLLTSVRKKSVTCPWSAHLLRYPKLLNFKDRELDKVCEEFLGYQAMSRDEIPKDIWDDAVCYEDSTGSTKVTYHGIEFGVIFHK